MKRSIPRVPALLAGLFLTLVAESAFAGPNLGGTLVVHDAGIAWTSDSGSFPSSPPASCTEVDAELPPDVARVWKIYAVFPTGSAPRLKAISFGEAFDENHVFVLAAGLPNAADFEIPQAGWPSANGGGVGIAFGTPLTGLVNEIYWFGGYGEISYTWSTAPHPVQPTIFVDDAAPPQEDPVSGLGSIGFGVPGNLPCQDDQTAACCFPDGACAVLVPTACSQAGGTYVGPGTSCSPNPCLPEAGACCFPAGDCQVLLHTACDEAGGIYQGDQVSCQVNPCLQIVGACCALVESCYLFTYEECLAHGGAYQGYGTLCVPNPCFVDSRVCCFTDGSCQLLSATDCTALGGFFWAAQESCEPNPCPVGGLGACCVFEAGYCRITEAWECSNDWLGPGTYCDPNPCDETGACCAGETCTVVYRFQCGGEFLGENTACEPNPCTVGPPATGACCLVDGACQVLTSQECGAISGTWLGEGTVCTPNPCIPIPAERISWGRIKEYYR